MNTALEKPQNFDSRLKALEAVDNKILPAAPFKIAGEGLALLRSLDRDRHLYSPEYRQRFNS